MIFKKSFFSLNFKIATNTPVFKGTYLYQAEVYFFRLP